VKIQEAALRGLHPTQLPVGVAVVQDKRKHLEGLKAADRQDAVRAGISLAQSKWAKNIPGYDRK
jgi:hypothetical protein